MKTLIRNGLFETNSSSTHVMTILSEDEYKQFEQGKILFNHAKDELVTIEDYIESVKSNPDKWDNKALLNLMKCGTDILTARQEVYDSFDFYGGGYISSEDNCFVDTISKELPSGEKVYAIGTTIEY